MLKTPEGTIIEDKDSIDEIITFLLNEIGGPAEDAYGDIIAQIDMQLRNSGIGYLLWVGSVRYPATVENP